VTGVATVPSAVIAAADETSALALGFGRIGATAPQARLERRRARALGECRQANQTAAQEASHRKAPAASPDAETSAAAKPAASLGPFRQPKFRELHAEGPPTAPPLAPLGRRERSAIVAWAERDRCPARPARHDADARPPRAIGLLQRAHRDGLTFVLVITGKGRAIGADSERGVLRRQVPQWLSLPEFRSLVVWF